MRWVEIPGFPSYSANRLGQIRHDRMDRLVRAYENQWGDVYVSLHRGGRQNVRGLGQLIASIFLKKEKPSYDTVINLDGDRYNCAVDNLVWRPRWFALKYTAQFREPYWHVPDPIKATNDDMVFPNSTLAAMHYGLLEEDIVASVENMYPVWPTHQIFEYV